MACFLTRRSRSPRALRENTGSKYTLYALSDRIALAIIDKCRIASRLVQLEYVLVNSL